MAPNDPDLVRIGQTWLSTAPTDHAALQMVARCLASAIHRDSTPLATIRALSPRTDAWPKLWIEHWTMSQRSPEITHELIDLAMTWLSSGYGYRLWASVFLRLVHVHGRSDELILLGKQWLKLNPDGRRADEVAASVAT
jgi:hypothetical protein